MLSDHDRVVLDEIERELSQEDPVLAAELTRLRPRAGARRARRALLVTAVLLMAFGLLVAQPGLFWVGVLVLAATAATRRWWPPAAQRLKPGPPPDQ